MGCRSRQRAHRSKIECLPSGIRGERSYRKKRRPLVWMTLLPVKTPAAPFKTMPPAFYQTLFHPQHPISHADMGLDILGRVGIAFDLFAQCCHEYPQRSYVVIPTASPYLLSDKGMSQYFSDVLSKQTQKHLYSIGVRCSSSLSR